MKFEVEFVDAGGFVQCVQGKIGKKAEETDEEVYLVWKKKC